MATNTEVIKAVAKATGQTQGVTKDVIDALEVYMKETLIQEDAKLKVCDITFKTSKKEAREGRNPRTGESIAIPERLVIHNVLSKNWKDLQKDFYKNNG